MSAQTINPLETAKLLTKIDTTLVSMANSLYVKERFDIGETYCQFDFAKLLQLRRLIESEDTIIQEDVKAIQALLTRLQNNYL